MTVYNLNKLKLKPEEQTNDLWDKKIFFMESDKAINYFEGIPQ